MAEPFRFPVRNPDDPLEQVGDLTGEALTDPVEREVVREVALRLAADGAETIGDAVDALEQAGPAGRRRLVDEARVSLGMDTLADAETHARWKRGNDALRLRPSRDSQGRIMQLCHAPGCRAYPTDESGMPRPSVAKRWWCSQHAHLAAAGDFDPPPDEDIIGSFGRAIPVGEERARLEAEEAIRLEQEAERTREREAIDKATERARQRYLAENPGENVMGVPMSRVRKQ
jgi:hypothetical protein